ncbi:uncharacterized protein Z518_04607 [Rhinocladiella mackenziei CBS 650.93]|uniref:FAD/NAD(P)-binding domain-containing protein n=1 Tax=Rhinocladiella mackenziei CBS 650.93 TaxID=1442369 RepID=A0A0D2ITY1_9EURO|nr:uncharacterized protein Z518_04607 [Rhinocladiella mackenziei CBS 650.93]KIX06631.1 hypothetical protein Z518_04607 [Rhinocladiella mackenziei CBS 650.93]
MGEEGKPIPRHEYEYPTAAVDGPYQILPQYHSKPARFRIACAGAGASGLCLAYKLQKMMVPGSWELTIFEKNDSIGGTWYENTYPGVACDIPAHIYTFTFDPNPNWSQYYAQGKEIQEYFEGFADRHGCREYVKLNTRVVRAEWQPDTSTWKLTLRDEKTKEKWQDWAHCFVNGTGILNNWKWPDIAGLDTFQGTLIHSAAWNHDVDLTDKVVGVIGSGSSSVQIVPELQKICKQVQVFIRSPTWISGPFGAGPMANDFTNHQASQYSFREEDKEKFRADPAYHLEFRKRTEAEFNTLFGAYQQGSELNKYFRQVLTDLMTERLGSDHQELRDFIIPKFSPGCRRLTPGTGFLEALVKPNVETVLTDIECATPSGLKLKDGSEKTMDVLVCATGFNPAFKPAFDVINGEGKSIAEDWSHGPNLYFGVSAPRFPNYYTIVGPGATWSNGTLLPSIETTIEHAVKLIRKMQHEGIASIEVKQEAVDDIYAHLDEYHKTTVWQEECRSWFKDGKVKNRIYLWPGSTIHFLKSIKDPRMEDYNLKYRYKNRFAFLGDGSVRALAENNTPGLAPYIRSTDHEWTVD